MKKVLLFLFVFAIVFSLSAIPFASAEVSDPAYDYARAFAAAHPTRDAMSGKEAASVPFLKDNLLALGYTVTTPEYNYVDTDFEDGAQSGRSCTYYHVVGTRDLGKEKTVVIGGYYGGFASQGSSGTGEGAEIAASVGALLSIAEKLKDASLDYNLAIAFWGGASLSDFREDNCGVPIEKIALYVGLDGVAAGERDYLYCDDVPRSHEKYFRSVASSVRAEIASAPLFKRPVSLYSTRGSLDYVHLGLVGVNRDFMERNISCATFVGGDWESGCGLYRYKGKTEISGTPLDTFEEIDLRNGGKERTAARLSGVANTVARAVSGEGLKSALTSAEKEISGKDLDSELVYALVTLIGGAAAIAFFLVFFFKQGKDRKETVWRDSFEKPQGSSEDPFSDLDSREEKTGDGDDDVFRF